LEKAVWLYICLFAAMPLKQGQCTILVSNKVLIIIIFNYTTILMIFCCRYRCNYT
jgi:hypothetical protein